MSDEQQNRMYKAGDRVKILRGDLAGQILTVRICTRDEIRLAERPAREAMSKNNVEPADWEPDEAA